MQVDNKNCFSYESNNLSKETSHKNKEIKEKIKENSEKTKKGKDLFIKLNNVLDKKDKKILNKAINTISNEKLYRNKSINQRNKKYLLNKYSFEIINKSENSKIK